MEKWAYYPPETSEGLSAMVDAGISNVLMTRNTTDITTGASKAQDLLNLGKSYPSLTFYPFTNNKVSSDSQISASWLKDSTNYPNIGGIYMYDEPWPSDIDSLAARIPYFESHYSSKRFMATIRPESNTFHLDWNGVSFKDYVSTYCTKVIDALGDDSYKSLMMDIYPVWIKNGVKTIKEFHLRDLDIFSTEASFHRARPNLTILTVDHSTSSATYFAPDVSDIRFQLYSGMAFGIKDYTYFTFDSPGDLGSEVFKDAMWTSNKKTDVFDAVKTVSDEIDFFDHVYLQFTWSGTAAYLPTNLEDYSTEEASINAWKEDGESVLSLSDLPLLHSISSDSPCLVGDFYDANNNEGFFLTDYSLPSNKATNISMNFTDCNRAKIYHGGKVETMSLTDNFMNLSLEPGDGAFIIPFAEF